jgi:uncharacterized membrane protein (UPF0127 family)
VGENKTFKVVVAASAQRRYRKTILIYLLKNFSLETIIEIEDSLGNEIQSLTFQPFRGTQELVFIESKQTYRYILFKETRILELKIIYVVDEEKNCVTVVELFPTKMNPSKMGKTEK